MLLPIYKEKNAYYTYAFLPYGLIAFDPLQDIKIIF
jgi:hypothetical protein